MNTKKENTDSKITEKQQKENRETALQAVPSKLKKNFKLTSNQTITLGWFIGKQRWEKEEEIRYTKKIISTDLGIEETTVISILKSLVTKGVIEKTFIGKKEIPSRVKLLDDVFNYIEKPSFENSISQQEHIPTTEETVVESREISESPKSNNGLYEILLGEIDTLKKEMASMRGEIESLKRENELLKTGMKTINKNFRTFIDEMNKVKQPTISQSEMCNDEVLKQTFGKDSINETPKYVAPSTPTNENTPTNAGNTPKIEYSHSDEQLHSQRVEKRTGTILEPSTISKSEKPNVETNANTPKTSGNTPKIEDKPSNEGLSNKQEKRSLEGISRRSELNLENQDVNVSVLYAKPLLKLTNGELGKEVEYREKKNWGYVEALVVMVQGKNRPDAEDVSKLSNNEETRIRQIYNMELKDLQREKEILWRVHKRHDLRLEKRIEELTKNENKPKPVVVIESAGFSNTEDEEDDGLPF